MNYADWIQDRQVMVFPEGSAENLVANHEKYIQDALIDLQSKVPCLQGFHRDNHFADTSYFDCGASVLEAPIGFIKSVHTITTEDCCSRVWYNPVTESVMRCAMENQQRCGTRYRAYGFYEYDGEYLAYPYHYECQIYPDSGLDKPCRAAGGSVTLIEGQLYIHPHLQENEIVVIEWKGIKKVWADSDEVYFGTFERQVCNAVDLYLRWRSSQFEDFDPVTTGENKSEYELAVAMMIHECDKMSAITPLAYCFNNCARC